jgi:hypothetical protein
MKRIKKLLGYAEHTIGLVSLYTLYDFCARLRCDMINYPQFIQKVIQKQDIVIPPKLIIHYDRWAANVVKDLVQLFTGFDISKIFYDKIYEGAVVSNNSVIKISGEYLSKATGLSAEWAGGAVAVFLIGGPAVYLTYLAYLAGSRKRKAESEI